MTEPLFTGVATALVTPFWENTINYPLLQQLIERQIAAHIPAIVLAGTTGEASTLSDSEKIELIKKGKEYAKGNALIIAGTGSNNTEHTIALSQAAQEAGADALLIVSPYYNKSSPEGLCAHYAAVSRSVDVPIIIYNVPSRTGTEIPVSVYKELSLLSNIIGVKECSNDITKVLRIRNQCGPAFQIWIGNDDMAVPAMSLGCAGVISVTANICPVEIRAMCDAASSGDYHTAAEIQVALQSLNELLFCEVNPIPVKYAMRYIGYNCGCCRLPLTDPSLTNKQKISEYFS